MYKNIFVKSTTNEVWIWDDKKGLKYFKYTPYAYRKDPNGKHTSIYGDKVTKVTSFVKNDPDLFESDVPETTRILVDMYKDSDMPSVDLITMGIDIEVEMISGVPDPEVADNEITSIAYHDSATDKYTVLILDKWKRIQPIDHGNKKIVPCSDEKTLLLKFIDALREVNPDIITGWNCIDENEWVSTSSGLVKLKNITTESQTNLHGSVLEIGKSIKNAYALKLHNGKEIIASGEHRIPVMIKPKTSYTYSQPLLKTKCDKTLSEIQSLLDDNDVYCSIPLIRNNKSVSDTLNADTLKLLGMIYTDGTFSKHTDRYNDNRVTISGIDRDSIYAYCAIVNDNKLSVNTAHVREVSRKRKETHSTEYILRFTPSKVMYDYLTLIYDIDRNKILDIHSLSKLSEKELAAFISGLIDGDGSVNTTGILICQSPLESKNNIYALFSYLGIVANIASNGVYIPSSKQNEWILKLLNISNSKRLLLVNELKIYDQYNSPAKSLQQFVVDDTRIIKIDSVTDMQHTLPMMDITTEKHYFIAGGITVHNCDRFDIPFIYNRIKRLLGKSVANRLSPIDHVFYSPYRERFVIGGISVIDYMSVYKKFSYKELPSYALNAVSLTELERGKIEYEGNLDDLMANDIDTFIEYNITDVELVLELDKKLQYIDLIRGICHIGHVPYEDFVYSSKYLEGALLTYLKRINIVAPNKPADGREKLEEMKESGELGFIGAYVKDPIPGKYQWMYDLDLTSLYPSILMTLNISPETKIAKIENWDAEAFVRGDLTELIINGEVVSAAKFRAFLEKYKYSVASNGVMYNTEIIGLIPAILNEWFDKRVEYKNEMKKWGNEGDTEKYEFYKKRQLIQKILLNSLYGVLGLPNWRWYDIDNAEAVTLSGQTVIKKTQDAINHKYNTELKTTGIDYVQYVDTDSVFVSCLPLVTNRYPEIDIDDVPAMTTKIYEIATEVQNYVNSFYDVFSKRFLNVEDHRLEIKQEMIARSGFWLKKKRYALWIISDNGVPVDKLEVKGLDVVRSSFPRSFQKFMKQLLVDILKSRDKLEIDEEILMFKQNMKSTLFIEVAKNSSIKDIKKYELPVKGEVIGKFAKGTPMHVKAAISYNKLLKVFKCPPKYAPIKNGDKIKITYLKENIYGLKSLAFRGDGDPPEILQFIQENFDVNKIYNSELNKKIVGFYDALNWDHPSAYKKTMEKFFSF